MRILIWFFELLSFLPYMLLYGIGNFLLFPLLFYVVRYRRRIVRGNLSRCFPDYSSDRIARLEYRFYRFFVEQQMETIKLLHLSKAKIRRRMQFENVEIVTRQVESGRSVILLLGHYANWEYIPSLLLSIPGLDVGGQVYRRLNNSLFDAFMLRIRQHFGTVCVEKNDVFRFISRMRSEQKRFVLGFMSDQAPSPNNQHYWTTFLNQETSVLNGVERIARRYDLAVIYLDMERLGRGHYRGTFRLISETPASEPENAITEQYARAMEKTILRNPAYYLWTHNRWKHPRCS